MCYKSLIFTFGMTMSTNIRSLKKPFLDSYFASDQRFPSSDSTWKPRPACSEARGPHEHLLHGESVKAGIQLMVGSSWCCSYPCALLGMLCPYTAPIGCIRAESPGPVPPQGPELPNTHVLLHLTPQHGPLLAISNQGGGKSQSPPLRTFCSPGFSFLLAKSEGNPFFFFFFI